MLVKCAYFREFYQLILAWHKVCILIRSMAAPPQGKGGICPKCPILDPPLHFTTQYITWQSSDTDPLQIIMNDIHIRYEDSTTLPGHSFAVGMTMDSLSTQSTDDQWVSSLSYCTVGLV